MLTVVVAEAVAIALLAVLVLGLLRSHALILRALHELGAGLGLEDEAAEAVVQRTSGESPTPGPVAVTLERGVVPATRPVTAAEDVVGSSLDGAPVTVVVNGAGRRTLLAFLSSGCSVCQTFWDEFSARAAQDVPGGARLAVVTKGPEQESVSTLRRLAGDDLPVVQSTLAWDGYAVPGSPYFVYVEDGVITGEGSSTTWAQVRNLMGQAVDDSADARRAAGRSGPGAGFGAIDGDDPVRMNRELLAAGLHPGHQSMYEHPERLMRAQPSEQSSDSAPQGDHTGHGDRAAS